MLLRFVIWRTGISGCIPGPVDSWNGQQGEPGTAADRRPSKLLSNRESQDD